MTPGKAPEAKQMTSHGGESQMPFLELCCILCDWLFLAVFVSIGHCPDAFCSQFASWCRHLKSLDLWCSLLQHCGLAFAESSYRWPEEGRKLQSTAWKTCAGSASICQLPYHCRKTQYAAPRRTIAGTTTAGCQMIVEEAAAHITPTDFDLRTVWSAYINVYMRGYRILAEILDRSRNTSIKISSIIKNIKWN
jgi:hypothetical protein